jgi:hypothetical protein
LSYVKAGDHAQQIGNIQRSGTANIVLVNDKDGPRGLRSLLLLFGH